MNISSFSRRWSVALGVATVWIGVPVAILAQDKPANSPSAAVGSNASGYDLEIVDGQVLHRGQKMPATLANVVELLRQRYLHANIVLSPGLGTLPVADLKLRASRLPEELEALRIACGQKFIVQPPAHGAPGVDPTTGLPVGQADVGSGLFVLEAVHSPQDERVVEAFNIGPYLQWLREQGKDPSQKEQRAEDQLEQVKKMIFDTLQRFDPDNPEQNRITDFQFHQNANLFVVIGKREAVDIARKIINVLPGMATIDDSVARHYGLTPSAAPGVSDPAADVFRRRYGPTLRPGSLEGVNPAVPPPSSR